MVIFFKLEKKQDFFAFQGVFFGPEFKWKVSVNPIFILLNNDLYRK